MKDDNLSPLRLKLGKVKEEFCGPGGNVRIAMVKIQVGEYKPPVSKILPLPGKH